MGNRACEPEGGPTTDNGQLTLLSWNIDGLDTNKTQARASAVVATINDLLPDVIFIQEIIPLTWDILKGGLQSTYHCIRANSRSRYYHGIFIRKSKMGRHLLHQRILLHGIPVNLYTAHLESYERDRPERMNQLAQAFQEMSKCHSRGESSLFGGDTNVVSDEVECVGVPESSVDVWECCGSEESTKWTWDMEANDNHKLPPLKRRLDRLFLCQPEPKRIHPLSFKIIGNQRIEGVHCFPSDHWGIFCTFNISSVQM